MTWLQTVTLSNDICTLIPLSLTHHDDLVAAAEDGKLWELWYTGIPTPDMMTTEIERRLSLQAQGEMLAFAIIDNLSKQAIGMTTYLNIDAANHRLEIGSTWLRNSAQRSGINTAAKLLLLTHAFEELHCHAVEFRTHVYNQSSRRAIERIGAKLDGILRNHMVMPNNTLRDTCVYSIIQSEWDTVKVHLSYLMHQ